MKKVISFLIILSTIALPLFLLKPLTAKSQSQVDEVNLLAGQTTNIGKVKVWNSKDYLYLKYEIANPDWCLKETHVHVAETLDGFPLSGYSKNPIPGLFDYKATQACLTEYIQPIPLADWAVGQNLLVAAHAVVQRKEDKTTCSYTETAWAEGIRFTEKGDWAMYFHYIVKGIQIFPPTIVTRPVLQTY